MSRPTAISPEEQEQIARRIGVLLLQAAPEDWQQITVEYRATGEYQDLLGEVAAQDGGTEPWEPPEELWAIFEHLREGMYRPDVGTWLSALYVVERPSSYRIDINFDAEPQWQRPLPRAAYVDELRRYPRTDDNVPDWMRGKLDAATAPADPAGPGPAQQQAPAPQAPAAQAPVAPQPTGQVPAAQERPAPEQAGPELPVREPSRPEQHAPEQAPAFGAAAEQARPEPPETSTSDEPGAGFRTALVFDDFDEQGRPLVATRAPVHQDEVGALRHYLENAPIVLASRDNDDDLLDPNAPASVPSTWHTDGVWVWPGAVPYYLVQYGVPPQPELVEHVRSRRFALAEVDDRTRDAAVRELFDQPDFDQADATGQAGYDDQATGETPRVEEDFAVRLPAPAQAREDSPAESWQDAPADANAFAAPRPDTGFAASTPLLTHRDELSEQAPAEADLPLLTHDSEPLIDHDAERVEQAPAGLDLGDADEEPGSRHGVDADEDLDETQAILARLHDRLTELGVDGHEYRIGSHSADARCLLRDEPGWVVTAGEDDLHGDLHFEHADQAAAFLLGSLLLSSTAPLPAAEDQRRRSLPEAAVDAPEVPEPSAPEPDVARAAEPEAEAPAAVGGAALVSGAAAGFAASSDERSGSGGSGGFAAFGSTPESPADGLFKDHREEPDDAAAKPAEFETAGAESGPAEDRSAGAQREAANAEPDAGAEAQRAPIGDLPRRGSTPPEPAQRQPEAGTGGHFLFTANQGPAEAESADGGDFQTAAAPDAEATRFQPLPTVQPGSNVNGAAPNGAASNGAAPNGFAPTPQGPGQGQAPQGPGGPQGPGPQQGPGGQQAPANQPLPQRGGPRPEQDPAGRPPAGGPGPQGPHGGPGAAPTGGAERRPGPPGPGMAGPPRQGPGPQGPQGEPQGRPGGPIKRPPQNGPGEQQQQPHPQQQQQPAGNIQPLRGEPPLTLYRDRRTLVLQPGTELDRFGDPAGNVTYAAHTPYSQRSLPPQWSTRQYAAFRVQRPVQALRGTAVPWFEQPGGGTAYVLPGSVNDLLADGTLQEINDAQRPPNE
ncbi:hypothetical protein GCM10027271_04250 [Saccharopolyspora gloriosae]|uniref:TNT domain-containing protein n=1 Tax=Saccharopolyspora gloriosae TaxID=455344 RepID=A0A840NPR8_9PSEU|nr:TNT domain-containing protein [Saccharopolyspora gloriosae]MBB5071975.1 hypothetical protein [Saccharopolyspora gloriosae]